MSLTVTREGRVHLDPLGLREGSSPAKRKPARGLTAVRNEEARRAGLLAEGADGARKGISAWVAEPRRGAIGRVHRRHDVGVGAEFRAFRREDGLSLEVLGQES